MLCDFHANEASFTWDLADSGEGFVGTEGGTVKYDAAIDKKDLTVFYKDFIKGSALSLPTGGNIRFTNRKPYS
jgi:hypothetical protein